ncbi:MAG: hypothetical protein H7066_18815 [Cytophagaceae bacterium]|nr:hypothetical protein [Gemmatimonadaceae bacterium]
MTQFTIVSPWRFAVTGMLLFGPSAMAQAPRQTDADHYTRYELLAPGTAKFRIIYEVTATTAGATRYFNPIRRGSIATDESVFDRATGKPLRFSVVNGREAAASGVRGADSTGEYIAVVLSRPVPKDGEQRILIDKTYEDARSYLAGGDTIVFTRPLGIKKNSVVLPAGYELVAVNYPSQVRTEADGRVRVSFMNIGPAEVPYVVRGRRLARAGTGPGTSDEALLPATGGPPQQHGTAGRLEERNPLVPARSESPQFNVGAPQAPQASPSATPQQPRSVLDDPRLAERARQDREIVYFLQQPETNAFDLYHDYTESRPGVDTYLNIVRAGSRATNPSAYILDTGEKLNVQTLKGPQITQAQIDIGQAVTAETEVVAIRFTSPKAGESARLRISETYTDPARYRMEGGQLVWDRAFGRPANAMVLPMGWYVTNCSVPAVVTVEADGRVRLDFANPRTDEVSVLLTARKR